MIRPSWLILARVLEGLALCLWLGGLIAVGALVAPVAFGVLSRPEAGRVVGECFRRLNLIGFACGGALLLALLLEAAVWPRAHARLRAARAVLVLAAVALGLYLGLRLFPEMNALRAAGSSPPFQRLHHLASQLLSLQMLLLLAELICSAASIPHISARQEGKTLQHGGTEITEDLRVLRASVLRLFSPGAAHRASSAGAEQP
jgi:MFS family permease